MSRFHPRNNRPRRHTTLRPLLELLEDRTTPATLTVNTVADDTAADGQLTLREAITLINSGTAAHPGNGLGHSLTAQEMAQIDGSFGTSDRILFASAPNTALTGTITIIESELPRLFRSMDLEGPGPNALTISGGGSFRAPSPGALYAGEIAGLTLANGPGGSGDLIENVGRLTLFNCVVGPTSGTGIVNQPESFLTVERSTIRNTNRGIENRGILTMTQCTVSGNSRHGLFQQSIFSNSAVIRHCTFSGNTSPLVVRDEQAGGGIEVAGVAAPVVLEHSIVAGNFRASYNPDTLLTTNFPSDARGEFAASSRFNLIGVDGGITSGIADGTSGNVVGTTAIPVEALLGPLADNGATTPTHALLPDSPARNAGDPNLDPPPATDQRGLPRVVDGRIDIGAYEDQSLPPAAGATVEGQNFLDLDGDGQRDPGEPGRDGWTIQLFDDLGNLVAEQVSHAIDRDGDGVIEPETERGLYRFTGLAPGSYIVGQLSPTGTMQTFPHEPIFGMRRDYDPGAHPTAVVLADLTGDGRPDLVIANQLPATLTVLANSGDGTFAVLSSMPLSGPPAALVAADLDGDGDIDVAISTVFGNGVSILRNNGAGVLTIGASLVAGLTPQSLVAADLDEDGDIDLATANYSDDSVSILRNNGDGTFAAKNDVGVGDGPGWITAADLEGDGRIDLFVTNFVDDTVSVLRNSVRFAGSDTHDVGHGPGSVVASDFDGDGDPDLAVANVFDRSISILRNNGDRTFSPPSETVLVDSPIGLTAADLDSDGDQDLIAAHPSLGTASILFNDGAGAFAAPDSISVGTGMRWPKAADMDGDNLTDLAFVNHDGESVSLLRNLTGRHVVVLVGPNSIATGIHFGNVSRVQVVSGARPEVTAVEGSRVRIPVQYTTTDLDSTLSGLGVRLHFDSSFMAFDGLTGLLPANFLQHQVLADTFDLDSDPATDQYLLVSWADLRGKWPERLLPTRLFDAHFRLTSAADIGNTTTVRFSASSTAVTHGFAGIPISIAVVPASLDVDGNGIADALSDGQLIVRSLFGFTGSTLIQDAVALDASRTDSSELQDYLEQISSVILDADANGAADAMTDGALVQRYLFGFRGPALVDDVVDPAGTRIDADAIVAFLDQFNPNAPGTPSGPTGAPGSNPTGLPTGRQIVTPAPSSQDVASGGRFAIDVRYATDPSVASLVGLGLRLHFDSNAVQFEGLDQLLATGTPLVQVVDDVNDFDDDPRTDRFVLTSFFDLLGRFPSAVQGQASTLYAAHFTALSTFAGRTDIRFTASSTALGHSLDAAPASIGVSRPRVATWISRTSGSWFDDSNWAGGLVPRPGDFAVIDPPMADLTVSIRGGDVFLQGLRSSAALEIADGSLDVAGDSSTPVALVDVRILSTGTFTVRDSTVEGIGPFRFQNEGAFRILGGALELGDGYSLFNRPGGLIDIAPGGGDPGLPGGGDPGLPGGGDPGLPGGGDPGLPGGGDPGLTADGASIDNFGTIRIGGRGVELIGGANLTNRSGGSFGIDVADGGADPPGTGGGSSDPPSSGGGTQPGGSPPGSGGGSSGPSAGLLADGSTIDNSGRLTILDGIFDLFGGTVFINRPGGIVEMPAPGGGDPGEPAPGGGDPGEPIAGGDPAPMNRVNDGSLLENRFGGTVDLGSSPIEVRGGVVVNSGVLSTRSGMILDSGSLSGIGLINGDLINAGILRPGRSPGRLTIHGDYTQTSSGVLELEVGGVRAGIDYDQLHVTGTSNLGGVQKILLIGGYIPRPTDEFQFLSLARTVGAFAETQVSAPAVPNGLAVEVGANGLVTIRPKPPTIERLTVNAALTSKVKSITIVFSQQVTIEPGVFRLRAKNGQIISWVAVTRTINGKTVAVITFPKHRTLPQGVYTLTVFAGRISNQMGMVLDGDNDGFAGGHRILRFRSLS